MGGVTTIEAILPQGLADIFAVTFSDGTSAECTADHLWQVKMVGGDEPGVMPRYLTTEEISHYSTLLGMRGVPTIPATLPTAYSAQAVPIDPYLLGILLGCGNVVRGTVILSLPDSEMLSAVVPYLPPGIVLKRMGDSCDYRMCVIRGKQENPLLRALLFLGVWGGAKQISSLYRYNTVDVRLGVIRGILDAIGDTDCNGQPILEQRSALLATDFAEVIQSIGGTCTLRTHTDNEHTLYRQVILYDNAPELFTLPGKRGQSAVRVFPVRRAFQSVKWVRQEQAQCIRLADPRGLYLTDHLIATHNTIGVSILAVEWFLRGKRVLYATPTQEQIDRFWHTVCAALREPIEAGVYYKNETLHIIDLIGTEQRIKAKTAWNADTLRGDYADLLILDEFQLMSEETWSEVGAPMMLDTNGTAVFIYTPPSLRTLGKTKAKDPRHASKMFKHAAEQEAAARALGKEPRWAVFHFTSHDNPHISTEALADIVGDMTVQSYNQEIMAEDTDEAPGALWHAVNIEEHRVTKLPILEMIVVGVDPSATTNGDEAGIIVAGRYKDHLYILDDLSVQGSPTTWAKAAVTAYNKYKANKIVAEKNNGGEMVSTVIATVDKAVPVELVWASRGKATRAEPVASIYEQGRGHHMGAFPMLEAELTMWQPGMDSPNRLDALVWAATKLLVGGTGPAASEWLETLKRMADEKMAAEAAGGY
jgi:hypothetical protein